MEYVDYFLRAFAFFLPYLACVGLGGFLEYRYGANLKADLASAKERLAALEASVKAKV